MAQTRYSASAMALHWLIALLLVYNYALGQRTETLARGPELFAAFQLHKSVGITILVLSLWRLGLRLFTPRPVALGDKGWAKTLSAAVHWAFYGVMIATPLLGWAIVSTSKLKIPTLLFGVMPLPHLPLPMSAHDFAEEAHGLLANAMLLLLLLHLAGVIRHQLLLRDALVERMLPARRVGAGTLALLVATLIGSMALGRAGPLPGVAQAAPVSAPAAPTETVVQAPPETPEPVVVEKAVAPEADGPVPDWTVAPGGRLGFAVDVNGERVTGSFARWTADIVFDPERLAGSSIAARIELGSVGSGDGQRDEMLGNSDFFAVAANPRATFRSSDIRALGGDRYEARGTLSIKGASRPLRLPFTLKITGDRARVSGSASLDRTAFGIGSGEFADSGTIAHQVAVTLAFSATRASE